MPLKQDTLKQFVKAGEQKTVFLLLDEASSRECVFILEDHADIHVVVLAQGSGSFSYRSSLADHAHIHWHIITKGSNDAHHELISECTGDDAVSTVDWIFLAKKEEKMDISVKNVFLGKRGGGEVTIKGIAQEKGNVRAYGLIDIGPQGGGTNTYLTEDVLMLDPTAKVDAIPALEIKTNDVKASHSATVSRVTEEDLFYFAARGIAEKQARRMYVDGFLSDLLIKIPTPAFQEKVAIALQQNTTFH